MALSLQASLPMIALCVALLFALSFAGTYAMRRYAIAAQLLDHPNARSSHSIPTPRGGGVAIVLVFTGFVVLAAWRQELSLALSLALAGGGLTVALIGFMDDRKPVPARWRFLLHLAAALWALLCMRGIPPVPVFGVSLDLGWAGIALAVLYVVWIINLYNFMDGIDGIAGVEAITVSLGGALTWWIASGNATSLVPVIFAACVAGFLFWNYPPARIFMGDAGSGFIGYVLAVLSLWAGHAAPAVFWCWFILLGGFMVDATTTLVRRVRRGERFNEAHRSHAYQYAARRHRSHERVTLAFGAINLLWLLPIALLVAWGTVDGVAATIVAYAPLVWLAFRYKAGVRAEQDA